jgi:hypothetical protein
MVTHRAGVKDLPPCVTARTHDDPGTGRGREAAGVADYSPITAQRKPIMMKKPLNRAIRPIPP